MATAKDLKAGDGMIMELDEACEFLGIARQTMYNRMREGTAPRRFKENGRWKFYKADLESYRKNERKFVEAGR